MHLQKKLIILSLLSFNSWGHASCDNQKTRENILTKIGYAPTSESMAQISKFCHYQNWIQSQLEDEYFYNDDDIEKKFINFETTRLSELDILRKYKVEVPLNENNIIQESFARRFHYAIYSENRIREMMVWFWFNHFNVYGDGGQFRYLKSYENIFRNHTFDNFRDILWQVSHHSNMLLYLDNDLNNKPIKSEEGDAGINENYAREFLELHTLGVEANYTQQDIHELAKILTGFKSIEFYKNFVEDFTPYEKEFSLIKNKHEFINFFKKYPELQVSKAYDTYGLFFNFTHMEGDKYFLGHHIKSSGDQELEKALDIVTAHPKTAQFISQKLALYFLGEAGNEDTVTSMVYQFKITQGNIKSVLKSLFNSQQFKDILDHKVSFKNPYEYYISTAKLTLNGKPIEDHHYIMNSLRNMSFGTHWKLTPEGYSLNGNNYLSSYTLHQYINFSKFIEHPDAFKQAIRIEENYYGLDREKYLDFLISNEWINK